MFYIKCSLFYILFSIFHALFFIFNVLYYMFFVLYYNFKKMEKKSPGIYILELLTEAGDVDFKWDEMKQ